MDASEERPLPPPCLASIGPFHRIYANFACCIIFHRYRENGGSHVVRNFSRNFIPFQKR